MNIKDFLNDILRTNIAKPAGTYFELLNRGTSSILGALDPRKSASDYGLPNTILSEEEMARFNENPLLETGKVTSTTAANTLAAALSGGSSLALKPLIQKGGTKLFSRAGGKILAKEGLKRLPLGLMGGFGASDRGREIPSTITGGGLAAVSPLLDVGVGRAAQLVGNALKGSGQQLYQAGKGVKVKPTPGGISETAGDVLEVEKILRGLNEPFNAHGVDSGYGKLSSQLSSKLPGVTTSYEKDSLILDVAQGLVDNKGMTDDAALRTAKAQVNSLFKRAGIKDNVIGGKGLAAIKKLTQDTAEKVEKSAGIASADKLAQSEINTLVDDVLKAGLDTEGKNIYTNMSKLWNVAPDMMKKVNTDTATPKSVAGLVGPLASSAQGTVGGAMRGAGRTLLGEGAVQQATYPARSALSSILGLDLGSEIASAGAGSQPNQPVSSPQAQQQMQSDNLYAIGTRPGEQGDVDFSNVEGYIPADYFFQEPQQAGGNDNDMMKQVLVAGILSGEISSSDASVLMKLLGLDEEEKGSEDVELLNNAIDEMERLYGVGTENSLSIGDSNVGISGLFNRAGTAISGLTDQEYADRKTAYDQQKALAAGILNKAREAGTLNEGEYQVMIANMPNEYTTESVARDWFNNVRRLLGNRSGTPVQMRAIYYKY